MRRAGIFTLVVGLLASGSASAREVIGPRRDVPPVSGAPMGMYAVKRGVQGPEGLFNVRLLLHVNASEGAFGKPVSLAPDLFYAVTDSLSLGLLHNLPMGILTRASGAPLLAGGPGLCLTGKSNGCPHVYDNLGFDVLYGLAFGDFHFSLHGSFFVLSFSDPNPLMLTLGAAAKFHFSDDVALFLDPQFGIAVNHRDRNKDRLFLPIQLQFQLVRTTALDLLTGVTGQLSAFGDTNEIPLGLALVYNINPHWDIGAKFAFDNLLGHQPPGVSRTDWRSLALIVNIRS
jgi:hypothetical protein